MALKNAIPFGFSLLLMGCIGTEGRIDGFRTLSDTPYGYQIVSEPVRAGTEAQRFEVRAGDCGQDDFWDDCENDRERSEFILRERIEPGSARWIAFSLYLPADFQTSPRVATTLGQIAQFGGPSGRARGLPSFPPLAQMEARGNRYEVCLHILSGPINNVRDDCRYFQLARVSEMRGRWTDILVHFDSGADGRIAFYVNGGLRGEAEGFIQYRPEWYFVKYGIYRSFISRHGGPIATQVAYYDEVRITENRAGATPDAERPLD